MHYHYCPQCGTKLTDKQAGDDGQVPFCTQCGKYWFDTFASCIIILLCNEENEVVLCKQNHLSNRYETITSGFITPGETAEHAAYREVQEELGLTVDKLLYEGTYWFGSGDMLMHGYIGFVKKHRCGYPRKSNLRTGCRFYTYQRRPFQITEKTSSFLCGENFWQ